MDNIITTNQGTINPSFAPEIVQTTARDLLGRPTSISYQSGGNTLATYGMTYVSQSNRLASRSTPSGTTNYAYSAKGNSRDSRGHTTLFKASFSAVHFAGVEPIEAHLVGCEFASSIEEP